MATPLLHLQSVTLTLGGAPLLGGAELAVEPGDRLCLVGRNGSGKSTLLKIAAGLLESDGGTRFFQPGATNRYLPQEPDFAGFATTLAYAEAVGLDGATLGPLSFASHPVLVRVGGEYYSRSIQKMNEDGSLSFFCAIDTGVVLTAARPVDLVGALGRALGEVDKAVGGIEALIGFDCVLRRLDAQNRQVIRQVNDLYLKHRVVGFNTYGEQYRTMHLNQTFTGLAIGRRTC